MSQRSKNLLLHVPLLFVTLAMVGPLMWMLTTSLKPSAEISTAPYRLLPSTWQPQNYQQAITSMPFWQHLTNSFVLCIGSVAGTLVSCSLAAYGFSRLRWPGRDWLFGLVIATMLLPWQATMIPRFLLLRELGLYDSLWALIVPTFCGDAFYIFLLRQFFLGIPQELVEAARVDGCGEWQIFLRIALPLSTPALVLERSPKIPASLRVGAIRQLALQRNASADGRGRAVHVAHCRAVLLHPKNIPPRHRDERHQGLNGRIVCHGAQTGRNIPAMITNRPENRRPGRSYFLR